MGADFKFVHCADLHLGCRFSGLAAADPVLARRLAESAFRSFQRIVDLVRTEQADFLVIAGDIFDEGTETPRTRYRFAQELARTAVPCFLVRGNHDHVMSWEDSIPFPSNVTVFGPQPDTKTLDIRGHPVEVTGVSFPDLHTKTNLAAQLHGSPDRYTVAVVHCSVAGIAGSGAGYAPCQKNDLLGRGVNYWALGHIHKRQAILEDSPWAVYPGDIQGLNPDETGPKGAYLVAVTRGQAVPGFRATQEVLWQNVDLDITGKTTLNELIDGIAIPRDSLLSLTVRGRGPLDRVIRADPAGFARQIADASGCTVAGPHLLCGPDLDPAVLMTAPTLAGETARVLPELQQLSEKELADLLLKTWKAADTATDTLRELAAAGRLRPLLEDAARDLLGRLTEGPQ